jgi:hypothetical protein
VGGGGRGGVLPPPLSLSTDENVNYIMNLRVLSHKSAVLKTTRMAGVGVSNPDAH